MRRMRAPQRLLRRRLRRAPARTGALPKQRRPGPSQTVYISQTARTPPLGRLAGRAPCRTFGLSAIGARETTTMTRNATRQTILAGAVALSVIAFAASAASAAPATTEKATSTCWKAVVNDWLNNQPNLKGTYPIPCYTQAIQHLNQYADIKKFSRAIDDSKGALLVAIRQDRNGPGGSPGGTNNPSGPSGSNNGGTNPPGGTTGGRHSQGLVR